MAYTPTVYTNDASSPDLDATNLNKSENGIKDAHLMSVPVDCSSRVAEYTGDGIPLIPDNAAGAMYKQDAWATTDGWTGSGVTLSAVGGTLSGVATSAGTLALTKSSISCPSGNMILIRVKRTFSNPLSMTGTVGGTSNTNLVFNKPFSAGIYDYFLYTLTGSLTAINLIVLGSVIGEVINVDFVYIGTGAYDYQNKDRSGNGNDLALTAVTPVNGKYGKEMSFNGTTSYAQASSPVIGTTGTIAVRFKINTLKDYNLIYNNYSSATSGVYFRVDASGQLILRVNPQLVAPLQTLIAGVYYVYILQWDGSTIRLYKGGSQVYSIAQASNHVVGTNNLTIGRDAGSETNFSDITVSHFRYDSRIWTADEARAWSLNPISIDSRV